MALLMNTHFPVKNKYQCKTITNSHQIIINSNQIITNSHRLITNFQKLINIVRQQ